MGSTKIPPSPEPPDYAGANREGVYADISTLPVRNMVNMTSLLGGVTTVDLPQQVAMLNTDGTPKVDRDGKQLYETKMVPTKLDFTGLGQADYAKAMTGAALQANAEFQKQNLGLRQELGVANVEQTRRELEAADPQAYAVRQQLTGQIGGQLGETPQIAADPALLAYARRIAAGDPSTAALNIGLQQALADYQRGGQLDPQTSRLLHDQVRAGQVARGNFFGDAAAVQEAATMGAAAEQRRAAALQQLLGVQAQAFGQNQQLNAAGLGALTAANNEQRAARNETYGREQQALSNASTMVLGQPLTNQFGSLAGAQQGAVGFNPLAAQINQGGWSMLNGNAGQQGAQFAQQNYANALQQWETTANIKQADKAAQNSLISSGAGAAAGIAAAMIS